MAPQAAARQEPRMGRTPRVEFHEEATRSQVRTLVGNLCPVKKPLRHASIRTRVRPRRDSVHVRGC